MKSYDWPKLSILVVAKCSCLVLHECMYTLYIVLSDLVQMHSAHIALFQEPWKPGTEVVALYHFKGNSKEDLPFSKREVLTIVKSTRVGSYHKSSVKKNSNYHGKLSTLYHVLYSIKNTPKLLFDVHSVLLSYVAHLSSIVHLFSLFPHSFLLPHLSSFPCPTLFPCLFFFLCSSTITCPSYFPFSFLFPFLCLFPCQSLSLPLHLTSPFLFPSLALFLPSPHPISSLFPSLALFLPSPHPISSLIPLSPYPLS